MTPFLARHITNAATGDRIAFIESPLLGDGNRLVFRGILPPHADGAPLHFHEAMTETFFVESGALEINLGDGETRILRAGESFKVEPGTQHGFRNPLDSETRFVTTADPGAGLEEFLRTVYRMGNDSMTLPGRAVILGSVMARTDMVIAGVPRGLQRALWALATGVAAIFGIASGSERPAPKRELAQ